MVSGGNLVIYQVQPLAFFISRFIYKENKKFWLVSSLICLFSGFLALNAGILALGIALVINEIFFKKEKIIFFKF